MAYTTWRKEIIERMRENDDFDYTQFTCTLTEQQHGIGL